MSTQLDFWASEDAPLPFVDLRRAASLVGISPSNFRKLVVEGRLPRPKRLGRRCVWDVEELLSTVRKEGGK